MKFVLTIHEAAKPCLICTLVLSFVCISNCFSQDRLDQVKSDARIIKDLKDVYRAYAIDHKIDDQKETINLLMNESAVDVDKDLKDFVKECESFKKVRFFNDTLGAQIKNYVDLTIKN